VPDFVNAFNQEKTTMQMNKPHNYGMFGKLVVIRRVIMSKSIFSALEPAIMSAQRAEGMSIRVN
jgi:hypothetical protein